jgi:hypothetical protein
MSRFIRPESRQPLAYLASTLVKSIQVNIRPSCRRPCHEQLSRQQQPNPLSAVRTSLCYQRPPLSIASNSRRRVSRHCPLPVTAADALATIVRNSHRHPHQNTHIERPVQPKCPSFQDLKTAVPKRSVASVFLNIFQEFKTAVQNNVSPPSFKWFVQF